METHPAQQLHPRMDDALRVVRFLNAGLKAVFIDPPLVGITVYGEALRIELKPDPGVYLQALEASLWEVHVLSHTPAKREQPEDVDDTVEHIAGEYPAILTLVEIMAQNRLDDALYTEGLALANEPPHSIQGLVVLTPERARRMFDWTMGRSDD